MQRIEQTELRQADSTVGELLYVLYFVRHNWEKTFHLNNQVKSPWYYNKKWTVEVY